MIETSAGSHTLQHSIGGVGTDSTDGGVIEVINPSTGRLLLHIPRGSLGDVEKAVAEARRAFDAGRWSGLGPSVRKEAMFRWAELIRANARQLNMFDAAEMGKPVSETAYDAASAADLVRFHAEAIDKVMGDVFSSGSGNLVVQRLTPRGVVAAITPWNFPTFNAVLKIAPALAAGNTVVLKPSELSSQSALLLATLALEAGIPTGVLNIVLGAGEVVGEALGLHDDVDMVTFTGSTTIGKLMLQYSGRSNMKAVLTECGGKSPQIVFDDGADLDAAAFMIARSIVTNQGQICSVGSRLLVQESLHARFVRKITDQLASIVAGDALDDSTTFGPLASRAQFARVKKCIDIAVAEGGRLVMGGKPLRTESGGFFIEPTVIEASPDLSCCQEEIFGPVLSVVPFKDVDEAITIANGTIYGLMAYAWTANLSTAMRVAKGVRSSVVVSACLPSSEGPGHAFSSEPAGQSGIGIEGGLAGIESYTRRQTLWFNHT